MCVVVVVQDKSRETFKTMNGTIKLDTTAEGEQMLLTLVAYHGANKDGVHNDKGDRKEGRSGVDGHQLDSGGKKCRSCLVHILTYG